MPYIIDGNNLAGKFDILFEDSFCERLIRILKKFNKRRKRNVILVTDDLEIINIIKEIKTNIDIRIIKASDFVKKIRENISVNFALDKVGQNAIQGRWGEDLNKEDIKKINDELLRLWGEN